MGLSFRGKTKGKGSWLNYSASKRGLHVSSSVKLSDKLTLNVSKHGNRATFNFGNGLKWTSYKSAKSKGKRLTKSKQFESYENYIGSDENIYVYSNIVDFENTVLSKLFFPINLVWNLTKFIFITVFIVFALAWELLLGFFALAYFLFWVGLIGGVLYLIGILLYNFI